MFIKHLWNENFAYIPCISLRTLLCSVDWVSQRIQWFAFYFKTSCASLLGIIGRNIGTSRVTDNHASELPRFLHRIFPSRGQLYASNTSSNISRRIQVGFRWKSSDTLHRISEENWRHYSVCPIRLPNNHNAGTLNLLWRAFTPKAMGL